MRGGRLRLGLRGDVTQVASVEYRVRGRRVAVARRAPFSVVIRRPRGRAVALSAVVRMADGSRRTLARRLR